MDSAHGVPNARGVPLQSFRVLATLQLVAELQASVSFPMVVFKGPVHTLLLDDPLTWRRCADVDVMTTPAGRRVLGVLLARRYGWVAAGGRLRRLLVSPLALRGLLAELWAFACWPALRLVSRHDTWVRQGFAALEIHSRPSLDHRWREWDADSLAAAGHQYGYHGVRFLGCGRQAAAGLAVWNAAKDSWCDRRSVREAYELVRRFSVDVVVPRRAVALLRWAAGAHGIATPVPCPVDPEPSLVLPSPPLAALDAEEAAGDEWLAWRADVGPVRGRERLRRLLRPVPVGRRERSRVGALLFGGLVGGVADD